MKLSIKFAAMFAAFGAAPLAVMQFIGARTVDGAILRNGSTYSEVAYLIGDEVDRNLFERYGDVQAFGVNDAIHRRGDWYKTAENDNAIVRAMNSYVALYGMYLVTMFVDTEGRVVAVNSRDAEGKPVDSAKVYTRNFRDAPWFKAAAAGMFTTQGRFSDPQNTKLSGTFMEDVNNDPLVELALGKPAQTIGFTAPVKDGDKIVGYWTNRMDFQFAENVAQDTARDLKVPVQVMVYSGDRLIAALGTVPAAEAADTGIDKPSAEVLTHLAKGEMGVAVLPDLKGEQRVHGYAVSTGALGFAGSGWAYDVSLPVEVAASAAVKAQRTSLAAGVVLLVLIAIGGLMVGRRTTKPLVEMANAAQRMAVGDMDLEVHHKGTDELGVLADAFRAMIEYGRTASSSVVAIGAGQTDVKVEPRSEKDGLNLGIAETGKHVRYLVQQVVGVAEAAERGDLTRRMDVGELRGDFSRLANVTNRMLDSMNAPIVATTSALERVAACDLAVRIDAQYQGDHARLKDALNTAVQAVRDALLQVSRGSEQVKAASSQIAGGSQSLASGASEQAASLTQTRAVLENVAQMTSRNAENAQHANALAMAARESSSRGAGAMEQMTAAVSKIRAAVENTAQIIRDINQIAFQTNLLALNAAVEAARAGDAGRGFAVVADEVRNLAQQAKQAAHKTEELLQDSIRQAERGETITQDVTKNLGEIVGSVQKVGDIIEEIATASREQAAGIEQVHKASTEMDQVTNQNAASSEELSSTAEELAAQAQELSAMVAQFELGEESSAPSPVVPDRTLQRPRAAAPVSPAGNGAHLIPFDEDVELRNF
ncbi:MAG: methyl-accepting chemotaxis protein [Myxococcota bacterium]